jgi:AP-1 complex subunit gamma-1
LTILDIEADSGLRVLGVNILGKFLSNRDNNIRYVALNTLIKVVAVEPNAVQRHRNTILDCLRDPDISIRRRALDLSFTLINESNVRVLIRELLAFLEVADNEFKPVMTSQIGIAADRFAPNKRWHVDTMLRVLKLAGNYLKEQILSSFVRLIATTPDLQTYSVQKLYAALKEDITQEGLTLAGSWVIGEYGDALLRGGQYEEEELVKEVKESDLVDLFETILGSSYAGLIVQQYIITASMKLTTRLTDAASIERLRRLLQRYNTNLDVEIQQRAVEYGNLFGQDQVRRGVLEKMPPPEIREEQRVLGEATKKRQSKILKKKPAQAATEDLLLDLMGDSGPSTQTNGAANGIQQSQDLLADILGGGPDSSTSPPPQTSTPGPQSNHANIMDLFNSGPSSSPAPAQSRPPPQAASMDLLGGMGSSAQPAAPAASSGPAAHPVYNKNDLQIAFQMKRDANAIQLLARFRNTGSLSQLSAVNLQAAVPKSQKLQLQPISTTELDAGQEATQQMRVTSVNGVSTASAQISSCHANNSTASASQIKIEAEGQLLCRWWSCNRTGRLVGTYVVVYPVLGRASITCQSIYIRSIKQVLRDYRCDLSPAVTGP